MKRGLFFTLIGLVTGLVISFLCRYPADHVDKRYIGVHERRIREKDGPLAETVYSLDKAVEVLSNSTCLTTEQIYEAGLVSNYSLALRTLWSAGKKRKCAANRLALSAKTISGKIYGLASLFDMNARDEYEKAKKVVLFAEKGPVLYLNGCLRDLYSVDEIIGMLEHSNLAEDIIYKERLVNPESICVIHEETAKLKDWVAVNEIFDDQAAFKILFHSKHLSSGITHEDGKIDRRSVAFTHLLFSDAKETYAKELLCPTSTDCGKIYGLVLLSEVASKQTEAEKTISFAPVVLLYPKSALTLSRQEVVEKIENGWLCAELMAKQSFMDPRAVTE